MLEIIQIDKNQIDIVYSIIEKDAKWLMDTMNMHHWQDYYSKERMQEKYDSGTKIFLLKDKGLSVATISLSLFVPDYYTVNQDGFDGKSVNYVSKFSNPEASALYVTALAVDPQHHGRGYASELMKFIEKYAQENNVKYIRFDARGDYDALMKFYKKRGYKIVGEMPDGDEVYYLFEKKVQKTVL